MTTSPTLLPDPDSLGQAIRESRKQLGLSQAQAAQLCGVSPRLWNETELGKRHQLGLDTVFRMMHTLGLDLLVSARRAPIVTTHHTRARDVPGSP